METEGKLRLAEVFVSVTDPRQAGKVEHDLVELLVVAVNAVLVVALNLADAVYFHYTQKRFTAEELFFADNDNSLALALRFAAENWYLVLAGIGLIVLLVKGYGRRIRPESPLRPGWGYYLVNTALLLLAGLLVSGQVG